MVQGGKQFSIYFPFEICLVGRVSLENPILQHSKVSYTKYFKSKSLLNKLKITTNIFDINYKKTRFKMFHGRALRTMILIAMLIVGIEQKSVAKTTVKDLAERGT